VRVYPVAPSFRLCGGAGTCLVPTPLGKGGKVLLASDHFAWIASISLKPFSFSYPSRSPLILHFSQFQSQSVPFPHPASSSSAAPKNHCLLYRRPAQFPHVQPVLLSPKVDQALISRARAVFYTPPWHLLSRPSSCVVRRQFKQHPSPLFLTTWWISHPRQR
jgi:hypothetical protein